MVREDGHILYLGESEGGRKGDARARAQRNTEE